MPLPDLHALRARARVAALAIGERLQDGMSVDIDAFSVRAASEGTTEDERQPIAIGPGALSVLRHGARVEIVFSTSPGAAGTALSLRGELPLDDGDVRLSVEGGPVSLAAIGLKDGSGGLADVERASVAGKGSVVLASQADALTFDGELRLRGFGLRQPRIASDTIHGLDVGVAARGMIDDKGVVRLDDLGITMGALHVSAAGTLDEKSDYTTASFHLDVPTASCQALLESVPTALIPTLKGAKMSGTFGARVRFAVDSRRIDDLVLDYDIQDQCRVTDVPPHLARERFKQPFNHRIYLPDGTTTEETTGPGTPNWTPLVNISRYMEVAVLTTEDGGFPRHHGFSHPAIKWSLIANLKARKFVRGASTITMQLAKNLFLTREKTLSRKLEEVILTDYLEQVFTKDELMELYLNVIEFGPNVYGIGPAARHYFGRYPAALNIAECFILSSILPAPLKYHYMRDHGVPEGWQHAIHSYIVTAKKNGLISEEELDAAEEEAIGFHRGPPNPNIKPHTADGSPDDGWFGTRMN